MTAERQQRFEARVSRRDPGASRVTSRDKLLLALVGKCLALNTAHVQAYLGVSTAVARRRCRTLKNMGLLTCFVPAPYLPNWYAITPKARDQLVLTFGGEPEDYRVLRGLPRHLEHHSMLVDIFISATLAAARSNRLELVEALLEHEVRASLGTLGQRKDVQVPDLVLVVKNANGQHAAFATEADRGTVSPNLMAERLVAYSQARLASQQLRQVADWAVLLVCPTTRRRNRLALRFHDEGDAIPEDFVFLAVAGEMDERHFFRPEPWLTEKLKADGMARLESRSPFQRLLAKCSDPCSDRRSGSHSDSRNTPISPRLAPIHGSHELTRRELTPSWPGETS